MTGKLILITGLSGSGKTTLVSGALQTLPALKYLRIYTTRPMRPGEAGSHEYIFVSAAEYDRLRAESASWDHTEYHGYSYGADVAGIFHRLHDGQDIICSVAPSPAIITQVTGLYQGAMTVTVLIDTPRQIAQQRTDSDSERAVRTRGESLDAIHFDHIFMPQGILEADIQKFTELLQQIIAADRIIG
jgi:guanylate kinase